MAKLSLILLSAPVACIGLSVPAAAAAADDGERRTVVVRYNDLNLASVEGRERLNSRVKSAVRTVCNSRPNYRMTLNEEDLYEAMCDIFLDPHDPEVIAQARRDGIPENWIEGRDAG